MRVLFIRLSSFGDVVFALPAARALKTGLPDVALAWAVEEPFAPLLVGAPYVDGVVTTNTRAWRRAPLSLRTLHALRDSVAHARAFAPDLVVDAQGLFKSAWLTLLVPARRKVGFGWQTATERVNCLATREHVEASGRAHAVDRALALAEYVTGKSGFDRTPDVAHLVGRPDAEVDAWLELRPGRPFAVLQPFASRKEKQWEASELLAFGRELKTRGLDPVVRWGPGEREDAERLVASSAGTLLLAPPTSPSSTARLAARAALFVGADTGPTHLAAAAGTPTLALFGTTPDRFAPIGPRATFLRATHGDYNHAGSRVAKWPSHAVLDAVEPLLA